VPVFIYDCMYIIVHMAPAKARVSGFTIVRDHYCLGPAVAAKLAIRTAGIPG